MDDFVASNLNESRNEWCARLVGILTPLVSEGVRSIFNESWNLCIQNDEANKYLMTFQNLLARIPKWNNTIVETERKRMIEKSGCGYLEELLSCVFIIQLKILTCIRVGNKQKKIDISIPKLDTFIHNVYINVARKVYSNVYLFEKSISPLQSQKYAREFELIIHEAILTTIRDAIPTEQIIRAYLDESIEEEETVTIENIPDESPGGVAVNAEDKPESNLDSKTEEEDVIPTVPTIKNLDDEKVITRLSFNDIDSVLDGNNKENEITAPKSIERLEEIGAARAMKRQLEEEESDDDDDRIRIHTDSVELNEFIDLDQHLNDIDLGIEEL
uniref:Uncharacterized protein n=1 Tax=viral metagenome TaxID=1070528 RepID=A0A6C0DRL7_9ZZZZ